MPIPYIDMHTDLCHNTKARRNKHLPIAFINFLIEDTDIMFFFCKMSHMKAKPICPIHMPTYGAADTNPFYDHSLSNYLTNVHNRTWDMLNFRTSFMYVGVLVINVYPFQSNVTLTTAMAQKGFDVTILRQGKFNIWQHKWLGKSS